MENITRPSEIPEWMWEYVKKVTKNFDSSHDLQHFVNVYNYTDLLIDAEENFDIKGLEDYGDESLNQKRTRKILLHAAFLHDVIDRKYVNEQSSIDDMYREFSERGYPMEDLATILLLIINMSFSKRKARRLKGKSDFKITKNSWWLQRSLEILCDADMLDAYRPERVVTYQNTKHPNDVLKIDKWCKTIFVKRILAYLPENYITTETARKLAVEMHRKIEKFVEEHYPEDMEMFDY